MRCLVVERYTNTRDFTETASINEKVAKCYDIRYIALFKVPT